MRRCRPTTRPIGRGDTELLAALVDLIAEQRGRQWGVDKACRDQVDPDGATSSARLWVMAGSAAVGAGWAGDRLLCYAG